MRSALALFLLASLAFARAGNLEHAYALTLQGDRVWVGGEAGGKPFVAVLGTGRWQGEVPGAVRFLGTQLLAGVFEKDAALAYLDPKGRPRQTFRFGGPLEEVAKAAFPVGGRVLLVGDAEGRFFGQNHGGRDLFWAWVEGGRIQKSATWGTSDDDVLTHAVRAPDGGFYLAGYQMTNEDCIRVSERGFVLRLDPEGRPAWIWRFGFEASSRPTALLAEQEGVWIAGNTDGPLFGAHAGGDDIFLLFLDRSGRAQQRTQWGSPRTDLATRLLRTPNGRYLLGESAGGLFGAPAGFHPFLARIGETGRPLLGRYLNAPPQSHPADAHAAEGSVWVLLNTPKGFRVLRQVLPLK